MITLRRNRRHAACATLTLVLTAGSAAAQPMPGGALPSLAPMIERVSPAVVNISVSGRVAVDNPLAEDPLFRRFFPDPDMLPDQRNFESAGSGVIVDADNGYVLTNNHVVENAADITVTLFDSRSMQAEVVGSDPGSDIAVLRIAAEDLGQISYADSGALRVGDYVVAIGNPFGFSHTVTSGIVSALGRSQVSPDPNAYQDFIQTDASINPGNSGGALVNLNGELVGINSAIISRSGGNIGIGFAIPVNMARGVMEQIVEFGAVRRGLLGVQVNSISAEIAATFGLPNTSGALVVAVTPESAAEAAGIAINDVIVSIDDEPVRDAGSLRNSIGLYRPGERVTVGLMRNSRRVDVVATLGALTSAATAAMPTAPVPAAPESLADVDAAFSGAEFAASEDPARPGLVATEVLPGSPAYERGLRGGDRITLINRMPVTDVAAAAAVIGDARAVILEVQREDRALLVLMR